MSPRSMWSRLPSVRMTLVDVLYVSYALPSKTLRPLVPNPLQLAVIDHDTVFVSLVAMRSTHVRASIFPVLKFNYNQFNIRTYVVDPVSGQAAVYFIRSGVTSRLISLATNTLGIPWERIELTIDFNRSEGVRTMEINGDWEGRFSLNSREAANHFPSPSFFRHRESAVDFLIRPLIGFSGNSRRLVRFTIQHPEVQPESWTLEGLDCPLLKKVVSIDDTKNPHSVFYLPGADFSIYLPPKRIT